MISFAFTKFAEKRFLKLPKSTRERVVNKLKELKNHDDIFGILKTLYDFEPATHRLRIGNFRLILELKKHEKSVIEFLILDIGHRKDIYR